METIDKEVLEIFKEFDPKSKGYLKLGVMQKALKHLGFNPSIKEIEHLIVEVDVNENGRIELDEFIEATKKLTNKKKLTQETRESFNTFDIMGTGYIKASDLRESLMCIMSSATQAEKEHMIVHFNLVGDRNISFEEFSHIFFPTNHQGDAEWSFESDNEE